MRTSDIEFFKNVWEASPLLFMVAVFVVAVMVLSRFGLINFSVKDAANYDKVEKEHQRLEAKLENEVSNLRQEVIALRIKVATLEGERLAHRREHDE